MRPRIVFAAMVLLAAAPAAATPPARDAVIVDWAAMQKAAAEAFPPAPAAAFVRAVEPEITDELDLFTALPAPYVGVRDGGHGLFAAIVTLISPAARRGESDKIAAFFETLNQAGLIRGRIWSRGYSGCTRVHVRLVTDGVRSVAFAHKPASLPGCPRDRWRTTTGLSFSYALREAD